MGETPNAIQDIGGFIADLRQKHPRLLLLIGETDHSSRQNNVIEAQFLRNADVGFFEHPSETPGQWMTQKQAGKIAHRIKKSGGHPGLVASTENMAIPRQAVFTDLPRDDVHRSMLPLFALQRLIADGVPEDDPVSQYVTEAAQYRLEERMAATNPHMAKVVVNHIGKHFKTGNMFAVGIGGAKHMQSAESNASLKQLLAGKGFDVITLTLIPERDQQKEHGTHTILRHSDDDYVLKIVDLEPPLPAINPRGSPKR